jgi:hypothetical protein
LPRKQVQPANDFQPSAEIREQIERITELFQSDGGAKGTPAFAPEVLNKQDPEIVRWTFVGNDTRPRFPTTKDGMKGKRDQRSPWWPRTNRLNIVVRGVTILEGQRGSEKVSHFVDWIYVYSQLGMVLSRPMKRLEPRPQELKGTEAAVQKLRWAFDGSEALITTDPDTQISPAPKPKGK